MRLDLDHNTEEQRPIKQSFCGSLRRDTHWKCLILSALITGCLAAIAWCRLTVITRVVINFYEMPIAQTAHASPCDDGYVYIPVAFVVMLYLVYLVECWHSHTRIELQYKADVGTVHDRVQAMREALPVVWWKAVCYHYVRRTRQVTRYRNGDAFTTTQVYYERINSHTARSAFNFAHCGSKDISKSLINLEAYPATKIKFSKGFSFATVEAENEFEDQRAQFFHGHERRDDYMETREGLDLLNVNFKEYMIAFADPDNLPWYVSHIVFWIASILLMSWPLRVCIEYKTAYVHYHVHKLFGCNYLDPSYCPGTMSRVSTMGSSELEMNIRNNYTLVPSYSEALLMENCYTQQTPHDPGGSLTPSSIVNGFIPNGGMTHYGTIPNGVAVSVSNGSVPNGNLHLANGHAGSGVVANGHIPQHGSTPNSLIIPNSTAGLPNSGHAPNGGVPIILSLQSGQLDEDDYLEYNSQRRRPWAKGKDPLAACVSDGEEQTLAARRPRIMSITTFPSTPESPEGTVSVVLEYEGGPVMQQPLTMEGYATLNAPTPRGSRGDRNQDSSCTVRTEPQSPRQSPVSPPQCSTSGAGSGVPPNAMTARRTLPMSASLSQLPSEGSVYASSSSNSVGMRSSRTAPSGSLRRLSSVPPAESVERHSSSDPSQHCPAPPGSPESQPSTSTSSSQVSLLNQFPSLSGPRRTASVELPLVHAPSRRTSVPYTSVPYRGRSGSLQTSSSGATSPTGILGSTAGTPNSHGSPRRAQSVQSCSSITLSSHSTYSQTPSCQSTSSSYAPSFQSTSSHIHSSPSTSSYAPSPHSSPRHVPCPRSSPDYLHSPHTSPRHVPSCRNPSYQSPSPHTSPRHVPNLNSPQSPQTSPRHAPNRTTCSPRSPHECPSPHTCPRHSLSLHNSPQPSSSSSSRHVPTAHSPPQQGPSPHTSPHHAPIASPRRTPSSSSSSQSSAQSSNPHGSPRHAPIAGHASPRRASSPRHTPSPHASPRRVLSSQSSTASSIQSPSPHTSPRHAPLQHASSPRHAPVHQSSSHSSPSPHASPRRLVYQTTPPPEAPPPGYEEALTMRVVQESPVHRPSNTTTTTTTVDVRDTELSETTRTTTRRYTLRCMETSL